MPRETSEQPEENDLDTATVLANLNNAVRVMESDPKFCTVWFDEFLQRMLTGDPPRDWSDADDIHLTLRFQREKRIPRMSCETVRNAVTEIAFRNKKNCVKDWLKSLAWDGTPRIDHFFEDFYGAEATAYTRAVSRNFLISMVARIYKPGCQVDTVPVLEGAQGIFKSSSLRELAGEHHSEQHESVTQKDFLQNLEGKWLIEISEMDSFSKSETSKVKAVISTTKDYFRNSFGRRPKDHLRQCVFVGTTNVDDWNRDPTGARRFWPIACKEIDLDGIRNNRQQLFAEAVHRYDAGESWWKVPAAETEAQQESRYQEDPWEGLIRDFITPKAWVVISEILLDCLDFDKSRIGKADHLRVATCLRRLGWEKGKKERLGKDVTAIWRPKDSLLPAVSWGGNRLATAVATNGINSVANVAN